MKSALRYYENIRIVIENGKPNVDIQLYNQEVTADGILIRNLFTMAGTVSHEPVLHFIPNPNSIPGHQAYSSVGIIEETGKQCNRLEPGSIIILPPYFSKYITLTSVKNYKQNGLSIHVLPKDIDRVDATFLPLLCLAIDMCGDMQDMKDGQIILLGCNLLGVMVLKLLNLEDIHPIVILDEEDIKPSLLMENGVESVFQKGQQIPTDLLKGVKRVFSLSSAPWALRMEKDILENHSCRSTSQCGKDHDMNRNIHAWMSYDVQSYAIELLRSSRIYVKDLIALHVHAESVHNVCQSICRKEFGGKALIYDW